MRLNCVTSACLSLLIFAIPGSGQRPVRAATPADYIAAEIKHSDNKPGVSIKTLPLDSDAFKGYTTGLQVWEPGIGPKGNSFDSDSDHFLYDQFCRGADVVLIGKLTSTESKMSSDEQIILSRYEFHVESILLDKGVVPVPPHIYIVNMGGSVVGSDGVKYRVKVRGGVTLLPDHSYLLALSHTENEPPDLFTMSEGYAMQVKGGRLYPSDASASVVSGETLAHVKGRLAKIQATHPCK